LATTLAGWAVVRKWASAVGAYVGALVVWAIITLFVTWKLPGVSFMFAWPLIVGALAARTAVRPLISGSSRLTSSTGADIWLWVATIVSCAIIVPIVYAVSAVMLGAFGPGGIAAGTLVALLAWSIAPQMEAIGGARRWRAVTLAAVASLVCTVVGMATVRESPKHPTPSVNAYALDADTTGSWLVGVAGPERTRTTEQVPVWLQRAFGAGRVASLRPVPPVTLQSPTATVVSDSITGPVRRLLLRVQAAPGTETVSLRANATRVLDATVDGRAITTTRYRGTPAVWSLAYSAPPDSGFALGLTVPAGSVPSLDITTRSRGLPQIDGIKLPERTESIVTI
jgi:hypothetical protein